MIKQKQDFGVDGYYIPTSATDGKTHHLTRAYAKSNLSKDKCKYYLEGALKVKSKIPSPDKYDSYKSFTESTGRISILKTERKSMFTEAEKKLNKDRYPAPNMYEPKVNYKIKGSTKSVAERLPVASEDIYKSASTPFAYDTVDMKVYKNKIP